MTTALRSHDIQELYNELEEYSNEYSKNGAKGVTEKAGFEVRADGSLLLYVRLLNSDGKILFSNETMGEYDFDIDQLAAAPMLESEVSVLSGKNTPTMLEVVRKRFPDGVELQIGNATQDRDDILAAVKYLFAMTLIPILIFSGIGGWFLARHSLQPVRELVQLLRSILQTGQLNARAPIRGSGDELDSLSILFNSLLERIERLLDTMKNSLDNVAHDLRTPMTRFRVNAELALRQEASEPLKEGLIHAVEESERILTTLHTLMDISEAQAGVMKLTRRTVLLRSVVERVLSLYESLAEERQISLQAEIPIDLRVEVDPDRMVQVLANLLDNALKFTAKGGSVEFLARIADQTAEIRIRDTGIGIEDKDMPHIFERLYRADRSRSSRGFGLGLSLVQAVVLAHGGSIDVQSQINVGTTFRILLPLNDNIG